MYAKGTGGGSEASTLSYQTEFDNISNSYFQHFFICRSFPSVSPSHTSYSMYIPTCFHMNLSRHTPRHILHYRPQTTDILHEHSVDSRRQLCSFLQQCNNKWFHTVFSILSLLSHLSGSQWCSLLKQIWFPTFEHLSFLRGLSMTALIPFTWEKSDLHNQPPWKGKFFFFFFLFFHSFLQISSWLTWERCISFT